MTREPRDPVRVGIVGCGRIAEVAYVPALRHLDGVQLVAVADHDPRRCAHLAPHVPAFRSADELVSTIPVDLVVVATPAASHLAVARVAAATGALSLVEKPPAADLPGALALAALEPGPVIGLNRRFNTALTDLRRKTRQLDGARLLLRLSILPRTWGAHASVDGPLLDLGPHVADLAAWLTGRTVQRVRAVALGPLRAELALALDGCGAEICVSHGSAWRESFEVRSADDRLVGRVRAGGVVRRGLTRVRGDPGPLARTVCAQLQAVAHGLRTGSFDERLGTAADGIAVMRVIDAALRSHTGGGSWVNVT